ncbi:MAG: lytic transglycosylase domain-containing protein, partial [Rhodoferax sp.]
VGAANVDDDNGYTAKVLAEHARLQLVAKGLNVPLTATSAPPTGAPLSVPAKADRSVEKVALLSPS